MHRQTNREMLDDYSSIFGVTKFHLYYFGRHFTLPTDHKELTSLFHKCRSVSPQVPGRIQRWALALAK